MILSASNCSICLFRQKQKVHIFYVNIYMWVASLHFIDSLAQTKERRQICQFTSVIDAFQGAHIQL